MLRNITSSSSAALAAPFAAAQRRCMVTGRDAAGGAEPYAGGFVLQPKMDIALDKFNVGKNLNQFRDRTGAGRTHDTDKYRKMYWRVDEMCRRAERYVHSQGYFYLPTLDFPVYKGCLPLMSPYQLRVHYGRHHDAYIKKLNTLIPDTKYYGLPLDAIIRESEQDPDAKAIFNNAAQHYNHCFFWKSVQPYGVNMPPDLAAALEEQYGTMLEFKQQFATAAMNHFGSGWVWLVYDGNKEKFEVLSTKNAGCPLTMSNVTPLLVLDAWEHAWYIDYENEKAKYVQNFFLVADWHWAERHWKRATNQEYINMDHV